MQNEQRRKELLEKANSLPLTPGVYLMCNAENKIIYVGKSRKLKNRVSQYFRQSEKSIKTARMVSQVFDFKYFLCDTEMEALTLENTLIKQHAPKYNIRLKDAKSYPYIKITEGEYPRLVFTRTRLTDKGRYFGPYSGVSVAGAVLRNLQKTLRLPTCSRSFPRDIGKERPCLYYQMGRCCGVCTGNVSKEEYADLIRSAADILRGNTASVCRRMETDMLQAAAEEHFEKAAMLRDTLFAIRALSQKQKVVASPNISEDVFGFYHDDRCAVLSVFHVREGSLVDKEETVFDSDEFLDEEDAISAFLYDRYSGQPQIPDRILLSFPLGDETKETLSNFFHKVSGHKVLLYTPERGELKTLCELAVANARERARADRIESERDDGTLVRLAGLLSLEVLPERIESYDISNFGKECKTCGMIVFEKGKFERKDYRTFRIKEVDGTDDYASMREAVQRRFSHLCDETGSFSVMPDLILLDGGRTHVSVVKEVLSEMDIPVPVFGMVKDQYHKTRALCTDECEISIASDRGVYTLIYRIQEEVHRFSVRQMSQSKEKTLRTSSLEKIPGVGKEKARILLRTFGNMKALKQADEEALLAAPGIGPALARTVYDYFHEKEDPKS